jgi:hypothetical protein
MSEPELPRAVASGIEAPNPRLVHAPRAAMIVGVLAAAFVYAVFAVHDVPERAIRLIGGKGHGVARYGGIVATWTPPAGRDPATVPLGDTDPKIELRRDGDRFVIELPRVREADAPDVIARLSAGGGLEFRDVIESDAVKRLLDLGLATMAGRRGPEQEPTVDIDQWRSEDGGPTHVDWYLYGHDRDLLAQTFAEAVRRGWTPPPHTQIAYERIEPDPQMRDRRIAWRSYIVSTDALLDGTAIANAIGSYDPNTNRPLVLLDFTREGAVAFGELTERVAGHKLATLLGGVVRSAPIIEGPIRGGRASITMGGSDPVQLEHERDVLIDVLRVGSLPLGGQIRDARWVAPSETTRVRIARVQIALLAGALAFVLAWLLVRGTRPERGPHDELVADATPRRLGRKLAWTLFALGVYALGTYIVAPGVNRVELDHVVSHARSHLDVTLFSVFSLGLTPLLTSFVTIEIAASIVPGWRALRDSPRGRRRLELATAIGAILVCAVQAYFVVTYLRALDRGSLAIYDPHMFWLTVATLAAGPALLVVLAGVISNRGLGNGYAVLFVWAWLWRTPWRDLPHWPTAQLALAAVEIVATATIALALLGWRVRSPGRVGLPLPVGSVAPLHDGGGVLVLVGTLAAFGITLPAWFHDATRSLDSLVAGVVIVVAFTALWAYAFARPGRRRDELVAAGLQPADRPLWTRGVVLSAAALVALFALSLVRPSAMVGRLADPALVIIGAATFADLAAEWRAHRCTALVAVWQLHDPLLVDATRGRLALAGIPHFIQATRMRTLLWLFGSYVPMTVFVPPAHAEGAHANLRAWLDPG